MLRAQRRSSPGELTILLSGDMNESADFQSLIGDPPGKICINTRGIESVNSVGIGLWLKYVERLVSGGVKIRYAECSPTFTNCLRYLVGPKYGGTVESVVGPFCCPKCKAEYDVILRTPDIFAVKPQLSAQICGACSTPLIFDEIPAEFFAFLG